MSCEDAEKKLFLKSHPTIFSSANLLLYEILTALFTRGISFVQNQPP